MGVFFKVNFDKLSTLKILKTIFHKILLLYTINSINKYFIQKMFSKKFIFIKILRLLVIIFNHKLSIMKIFIIFIFQIGNSSIIRKLPIYEILKILRAPYLIMELLFLIFKIPHKFTFLSLHLSNLINIFMETL